MGGEKMSSGNVLGKTYRKIYDDYNFKNWHSQDRHTVSYHLARSCHQKFMIRSRILDFESRIQFQIIQGSRIETLEKNAWFKIPKIEKRKFLLNLPYVIHETGTFCGFRQNWFNFRLRPQSNKINTFPKIGVQGHVQTARIFWCKFCFRGGT